MRPSAPLALLFAMSLLTSAAHAQHVAFGDVERGTASKDFVPALTGGDRQGEWKLVDDATADRGKALAQVDADPTDYRFPLAIYMPTVQSDIEATIHFRPISGKVDQAAVVAVRLVNRNNYYVARANALENNVRFYRVIAGRREQIATANVPVDSGKWHTLGLRAEGPRFTVSLDGKALHTSIDTTFPAPGKIALWTKADSLIHFDWLDIKPVK